MTITHWAVFGATGGLGTALSRELAARGASLHLFARDDAALDTLATDLRERYAVDVTTATFDALDPTASAHAIQALADHGPTGLGVVWAIGSMEPETDLAADPGLAERHVVLNLHAPVRLFDHLLDRLTPEDRVHLVALGSVAGDRVRGSRLHYGTAKAGLHAYLEGLPHRYGRMHGPHVTVTTVKPGPTRTPMTAGLGPQPLMAEPADQARLIVDGIERGRAVIYAPPVWGAIMHVIRHLPRWVFQRLG